MKTRIFAAALTAAAILQSGAAFAGDAPLPPPPPPGPVVELFPIVQDGKWGYMDKAGKVVVKPEYDCAWDFSDGLAAVQVGLLRGYIDAKGAVAIKPQYWLARPFSEGVAAVYVDAEKWGNFFVFNRGSGRWVYIDKTGNVAIKPTQEVNALAGEFHGGQARVAYWVRQGHMTRDGKIRNNQDCVYAGNLSEGMAAYQRYHGKFGFMDASGKDVIPPNFDEVGNFSEGLAPVKKDGKWSFLDKTGKPAFEARFDGARDFSEGLAAVAVDQAPPAADPKKPNKPVLKWGCIDKTGKVVIEPRYDSVAPCAEGMIRFMVAGKYGYMDKTGKVVVEPKFTLGWEFSRGLARVEVETPATGPGLGKQGYIDKTGAFVWQPSK